MDFNVRSESVDVEQIMEQIRARIREKRGVDYTEQQLRELAAVKLERFLDPRGVRSDLLQRFKERQPQYEKPLLPLYAFEDTTIYETHRGPLRWIRSLLNPILKLFFNPQPIIHALHAQVEINALNLEREGAQEKRRMEMETLYYEIIHNLVFELTRTGIEVKNLKMRVESLVSRLEFNERRARALESVVVYKPSSEERTEPVTPPGPSRPRGGAGSYPQAAIPDPGAANAPAPAFTAPTAGVQAEGPGQRSRRRRRRRGRRGGQPASAVMGPSTVPPVDPSSESRQYAEPAPAAPSGVDASTSSADRASTTSDQGPSTLRHAQGRPEPGRGTTSSGQSPSTDAAQGGSDPEHQ